MSNWKKELKELIDLRDAGGLTEEEFRRERDQLMAIRSDSGNVSLSGDTLPIGSIVQNYKIISVLG